MLSSEHSPLLNGHKSNYQSAELSDPYNADDESEVDKLPSQQEISERQAEAYTQRTNIINTYRNNTNLAFSYVYKNQSYSGYYYPPSFRKSSYRNGIGENTPSITLELVQLSLAISQEITNKKSIDLKTLNALTNLQYQIANTNCPEIILSHKIMKQIINNIDLALDKSPDRKIFFNLKLFLEFKMVATPSNILKHLDEKNTRIALENYFYLAASNKDILGYSWVQTVRETILDEITNAQSLSKQLPSALLTELASMAFFKQAILSTETQSGKTSSIAQTITMLANSNQPQTESNENYTDQEAPETPSPKKLTWGTKTITVFQTEREQEQNTSSYCPICCTVS